MKSYSISLTIPLAHAGIFGCRPPPGPPRCTALVRRVPCTSPQGSVRSDEPNLTAALASERIPPGAGKDGSEAERRRGRPNRHPSFATSLPASRERQAAWLTEDCIGPRLLVCQGDSIPPARRWGGARHAAGTCVMSCDEASVGETSLMPRRRIEEKHREIQPRPACQQQPGCASRVVCATHILCTKTPPTAHPEQLIN